LRLTRLALDSLLLQLWVLTATVETGKGDGILGAMGISNFFTQRIRSLLIHSALSRLILGTVFFDHYLVALTFDIYRWLIAGGFHDTAQKDGHICNLTF
jgi:hypothetical protein